MPPAPDHRWPPPFPGVLGDHFSLAAPEELGREASSGEPIAVTLIRSCPSGSFSPGTVNVFRINASAPSEARTACSASFMSRPQNSLVSIIPPDYSQRLNFYTFGNFAVRQ